MEKFLKWNKEKERFDVYVDEIDDIDIKKVSKYEFINLRFKDLVKLLNPKILIEIIKFSKEQGFKYALHYKLGRIVFKEDMWE